MHVIHRRYVACSEAHYAGDLVDGAFGLAPVRGGDVEVETGVVPALPQDRNEEGSAA
ncbi:hypothetical protein [Amycolatopsis sp. NPDC049868]|uniref:hypothetical protein n=1 Tax=Amycolatopsis sp. NPDC049868 TaxID=3363934 RepID=UPI00378861D3